jgi:hypothetical protein
VHRVDGEREGASLTTPLSKNKGNLLSSFFNRAKVVGLGRKRGEKAGR